MRGLIYALLFSVLTACAALSGLKSPEVAVSDIRLTGGNLLEQRFKLTLRISNPNQREIAIEGVTFTLDVADKPFARGVGAAPVILAPLSDTLVELDATAQMLNILQGLPRLLEGDGKAAYRLQGEVVTRAYGRLPFKRDGTMNMPALNGSKPRSETL